MEKEIINIILGVTIPAFLFFIGRFIRSKWKKIDRAVDMILPNGGSAIPDKIDNLQKNLNTLSAASKAVLYITPHPLFKTDEQGLCIFVNKAYTEITGLSERECLGTGWSRAIHPKDRDRVVAEWNSSVQSLSEFEIIFTWIHQKTGHHYEVGSRATIMRNDKTDAIIGTIGIIDVMSTNNPNHIKFDANRKN